MDAWVRAWRCWDAVSKVFFSEMLAISSGPGALFGESLSMARWICFIVMAGLLWTGSGYTVESLMSEVSATGGGGKNASASSLVFPR